MDKQDKTISELTLDQMDKASGGVENPYRKFYCEMCGYETVTNEHPMNCPLCGNPLKLRKR